MDLQYFSEDSSIVITVTPGESDAVSVIMRLVMDDLKARKIPVPIVSDRELNELAGSKKKYLIRLAYEYQEFALTLLEEISLRWNESGYDARLIDEFLFLMDEQFPAGHGLQ